MAKPKVYIETNMEKLAANYFKIAGVNSLAELKETIYWKYFEEDKLNALKAMKKKEFETKTKVIVKKDLVFNCSNCKKSLGYQVFGNFVLEDLKFSYENNILEITCSCGKNNSFPVLKEKKQKELNLK